jgi:hypothetical protein
MEGTSRHFIEKKFPNSESLKKSKSNKKKQKKSDSGRD